MRRIVDRVVLCVVLAAGAYLWYTHPAQVRGVVRMVQNIVMPCARPLTYSIGSIDPRFHISTSTLIADLVAAEGVWEKPTGKDFFSYAPSGGDVSISLVYDERQAATDMLASAGIKVTKSKRSYEDLKARYDAVAARVANEQSAYEAAATAYQRKEADHNARVAQWNVKGGAPEPQYTALQEERQVLGQEFSRVQALGAQLNADIDTANALATTLNQLIVQLNLDVRQYNAAGAAAGEFEEGVYVLDHGEQTIAIYEYSDNTHLIRVLAHEMGHALGLDHVADTAAIMYPVNEGDDLVAKPDDIVELERACRIRS